MGFSHTCCATRLPIDPGQPIRYFLVTKHPSNVGHETNPRIEDLWFPRTIPLRAVYDDRGNLRDIEDDAHIRGTWMDGFRQDLVEVPAEPSESSSQPQPAAHRGMSFDELQDALLYNRVRINRSYKNDDNGVPQPYDGVSLPVGRAFIREDVWQELLNMSIPEGSLYSYIGNIKRIIDVLRETKPEDRSLKLIQQVPEKGAMVFHDPVPFSVGIGTSIKLLLQRNRITKKHVYRIAEFAYIEDVLRCCRVQWHPSTRSGPQFGMWDMHVRFHRMAAELAQNKADEKASR